MRLCGPYVYVKKMPAKRVKNEEKEDRNLACYISGLFYSLMSLIFAAGSFHRGANSRSSDRQCCGN